MTTDSIVGWVVDSMFVLDTAYAEFELDISGGVETVTGITIVNGTPGLPSDTPCGGWGSVLAKCTGISEAALRRCVQNHIAELAEEEGPNACIDFRLELRGFTLWVCERPC